MVARTGIEPASSALRGRCPNQLDDRATSSIAGIEETSLPQRHPDYSMRRLACQPRICASFWGLFTTAGAGCEGLCQMVWDRAIIGKPTCCAPSPWCWLPSYCRRAWRPGPVDRETTGYVWLACPLAAGKSEAWSARFPVRVVGCRRRTAAYRAPQSHRWRS